MDNCKPVLKQRHSKLDFLYFKLLSAIPFFTMIMGFWKTNPWMILVYLLWFGVHMALVYRLLCTHCPHYGAYDGKTECHFLWGVPVVYTSRVGTRQNIWENLGTKLLLIISIFLPVYWLAQNWELLVIYLLSVAVLMITMMRYECTRCIHEECPHNCVPKEE